MLFLRGFGLLPRTGSLHSSRLMSLSHKNSSFNPYDFFTLPRTYKIDNEALTKTYHNLMRQTHPDVVTSSPQGSASSLSIAYKSLMDPIERARALIQVKYGLDVLDEKNRIEDQDYLEKFFDLQMTVEETELKDLPQLLQTIEEEIETCVKELEKSIDINDDKEKAIRQVNDLVFYSRLKRLCQSKLHDMDSGN